MRGGRSFQRPMLLPYCVTPAAVLLNTYATVVRCWRLLSKSFYSLQRTVYSGEQQRSYSSEQLQTTGARLVHFREEKQEHRVEKRVIGIVEGMR